MTLHDFIVKVLPWFMSAVTIWMTLMAGNKHPKAWAVGIGNQFLWATWIFVTQTWGLAPMCVALTWVYIRNHFKWAQPEGQQDESGRTASADHPRWRMWFLRIRDVGRRVGCRMGILADQVERT